MLNNKFQKPMNYKTIFALVLFLFFSGVVLVENSDAKNVKYFKEQAKKERDKGNYEKAEEYEAMANKTIEFLDALDEVLSDKDH